MPKENKLTVKQEKYTQGLFSGLTQREAYKRAFNCKIMSDKTIDEKACRLANTHKVRTRLDELKSALQNRNMVTIEKVLREYARLGFFDPRKLFNADGSPKGIMDLDSDTAAAIAGLDVAEIYEGSGSDRKFVGYKYKLKIASKVGALDSLAKHLGMFIDRTEIAGPDGGAIHMKISRTAAMTDEELEAARAELATDDDGEEMDILSEEISD